MHHDNQMWQLENCTIDRIKWGDDKGKLVGQLRYSGRGGAIELRLDEATCVSILDIVGEAIIAESRSLAKTLTREALFPVPANATLTALLSIDSPPDKPF